MTNTLNVLPKSGRNEVYDWLRGLASISVVIGHYRPLGVDKMYLIWSILFFVLVTICLISQSQLSVTKTIRRFLYVTYVYTVFVVLFYPLVDGFLHIHTSLTALFLDPRTVLIDNPYFGNLWYLGLYVQLILFFLLFQAQLRRSNPWFMLIASLVLSQLIFYVTQYRFHAFKSIFIPSWIFIISLGWYVIPGLVKKTEMNDSRRGLRIMVLLAVLCMVYSVPSLRPFLGMADNRTFILNTVVFVAVFFLATEIFYLLRRFTWFQPIKKGVIFISKYTLMIYVYHGGIWKLAKGTDINMVYLTLFSIISGALVGAVLHRIYLKIEKIIMRPWEKPAEAAGVAPGAVSQEVGTGSVVAIDLRTAAFNSPTPLISIEKRVDKKGEGVFLKAARLP